MKSIPKLLTALFLIIFIIELFGFLFILLAPTLTQAADPVKFVPQITVGNFVADKTGKDISPTSIGEYIREIFKYAIGAVGILAAVVLMIGGIVWLTSGGNQTRVGEAKSWIAASLSGLVIAICSYLILTTINPELVKIKSITPTPPSLIGCCVSSGGATNSTKEECDKGGGNFESGSCPQNNNVGTKKTGETCSSSAECGADCTGGNSMSLCIDGKCGTCFVSS